MSDFALTAVLGVPRPPHHPPQKQMLQKGEVL